MKGRALLPLLLLFALAQPALAASKVPIQLTTLAPTVSTNFSAGDQVSAMATTPTAIYLSGTVETSTSQLLTAAPLGKSDGFLVALAANGSRLWDVKLGTSGDDVATAICVDLIGNIWIAGASAVSTSAPAPGLNRLTVWEVNSQGTLVNTYSKESPDLAIPTAITPKGANFVIQGSSSKAGFPTFSATLNPAGKIGSINYQSTNALIAPTTRNVTSVAYSWQSFTATGPIKGIVGLPAHQSTNLLTRSGIKDKSIKAASSVLGSPLALQYASGIGVVLLTQGSGSYYLTIIHTK